MNRKDIELQMKALQEENGGKLFIGMIHELYGPLRGLNCIVEGADPKDVVNMIDDANKPISNEREFELAVKRMESGLPPRTPQELVFCVWTKTMLKTTIMVLPFEMVDETENPPAVVDSLAKALTEINKSLAQTEQLQKGDAWFFRRGII